MSNEGAKLLLELKERSKMRGKEVKLVGAASGPKTEVDKMFRSFSKGGRKW